jgi:hypothetical protein
VVIRLQDGDVQRREMGERARRRKGQEKAQGKGDYIYWRKKNTKAKANVTVNMPYFFNHTHII